MHVPCVVATEVPLLGMCIGTLSCPRPCSLVITPASGRVHLHARLYAQLALTPTHTPSHILGILPGESILTLHLQVPEP